MYEYCNAVMYMYTLEKEIIYCAGGEPSGSEGGDLFSEFNGTSLRAFFNESSVTPFCNFVSPTIGGSPFFTNSYSPVWEVLVSLSSYPSMIDYISRKQDVA